jgi:mono/diheme cytochrome c family protein
MRSPFTQLVCLATVAIGTLSSFKALNFFGSDPRADEDHSQMIAEELPHARPPRGVPLTITEGTWLRAPGEEWIIQQNELARKQGLEPRFTEDPSAADGEGAWIDSTGFIQKRYDEEEDFWAYWQWVGPAQLTRGRRDFVQFCSSCHGLDGDGYGRSGQWLRPSPRDFRQTNFKFTKVLANLPTDDALKRLIKRGLDGTPMLPWDLSDEQLTDIVQYIKSLSPEGMGWRDPFTGIGSIVEAGENPWAGRENFAIKHGEKVYHGVAQCMLCHPGYVNPRDLPGLLDQPEDTVYRENLYLPVLKDSEYEVLGEKVKILPPDFTFHTIRSGQTPQDLYETIASGIKGTAMPAWKGSLSEEDLWALAYYVQDLVEEYKDKPAERRGLMERLREGL